MVTNEVPLLTGVSNQEQVNNKMTVDEREKEKTNTLDGGSVLLMNGFIM